MSARENALQKGAARKPESPHDPGPRGEGRFASPAAVQEGAAQDDAVPDVVLRTSVFDADDLRRALTRIAHEIVERNHGAESVVLAGLYTRGVALAERIAAAIAAFEHVNVPIGTLDISFYRDDIGIRPVAPLGPTEIPDISGKVVVLVDDVLFTGRTARAALDALLELGRPRAIQLAVLLDRGHRELPLRADFVGKNLPTRSVEDVRVRLSEVDGGDDGVELWGPPEGAS
jgi:pyrimidine operon attenuation protein/uracil phosphoribosyltransferase